MGDLLKDYEYGCGFKRGEKLRARQGYRCPWADSIEDGVFVVLKQSALNPSRYTVIGERLSPRDPADRYLKTEISGHNYDRI